MSKRYVCIAPLAVPLCDDDGYDMYGKQCVVETGRVWEITDNDVIGGEIHLEEIGKPWRWLEIPRELFEACFEEQE